MTDLATFYEQQDRLCSLIYNYTSSCSSNSRRSRPKSATIRWVVEQPWKLLCRSLSNLITVQCDLDGESKTLLAMEASVIIRWQYDESNEVRNVLIPTFWSAEIIANGRGVHPFIIKELKVGAFSTKHSKLEQTVDEKTKDSTIRYEFTLPEDARRLFGLLSFGMTFQGTAIEAEVELPVGPQASDPLPPIRRITRDAIDTLVRLKERQSEASTDEAEVFELRFGDTSFTTDRFTLEEHSEYFRCFFSSSFSFKEHDQKFTQSDLDPKVGEIIQTYLTTGRIEKVKLEQNLEDFMRFVHEKQFLELVAIGEVMMIQLALDALTDKDIQEIIGILSLGAELDLTMIVLFGKLIEEEYFSDCDDEAARGWELTDRDREAWTEFLANGLLYNAKKHSAVNGSPAVPEDIRLKLLDPAQPHITPLAELLPENRITNINGKVPELSLNGKGDSYIWKNVSQKKPFRNFADFSAAFSVFMAYRITVDPKLSVPLARYLEVVATIARLHPSSNKWMAYDELHRMYASLDVTNYALWTCRHNDSYNQMMLMPDQSDQADHPATSSSRTHRLNCNYCDEPGHLSRECPKKARRDSNHQPFRTGPATGGYFNQICRNYNSGYCADPCPAGRDHKCFRCSKNHPSTDCTDEAAPRGDRRKKHST